MSGVDVNAHTRAGSVAYKRSSISGKPLNFPPNLQSSPSKVRLERKRELTGDSIPSGVDTPNFLGNRQQRKRIVQLGIALSLFLLVWPMISTANYQRRVSYLSRQRKARLSGVGESFVLPKRWRDYDAGDLTIPVGEESLPECKRVLLYVFKGWWGFASEINIYLRAAVIANKLGYTLLADDTEWNYGALRDYFLPRQIHCRPPKDWFLKEAAVPLGSKRWKSADRVWYSRELLSKADDWIREETIDPTAMKQLRNSRFGHLLPEGATLPEALEDVFVDFETAVKDFWRPNQELSTMIRLQRMELGLGEGGLRHRKHSPTWGGNRRPGETSERRPVEELTEEEHDFDEPGGAERSDRGPVIGAHVRMGDKAYEWKKDMDEIGIENQTYGNLTVFLEAATESVRRLAKSSIAEPSYDRSHPTIFPETATPTLLVMTAEADVLSKFAIDENARVLAFDFVRTSPPSDKSLRRWAKMLNIEATPLSEMEDEEVEQEDVATIVVNKNAKQPNGPPQASDGSEAASILKSYKQQVFNALPRSLRVHLTRHFLRDLTTLSLYTDAFVITGSSNIGRLACLIAGSDAVVGPRDISGKGLGGRVRSIDGYWYPTAYCEREFLEVSCAIANHFFSFDSAAPFPQSERPV